jgi:uncharacterized protein YabE (DUF348 family)
MSHLINIYLIPLRKLIVSGVFLVLISAIIFSNVTNAGNVDKTVDGKLITIHDRGTEKVIVSHAATVGDALEEAGIYVSNKDAVEPAVDEKLVASDYQVNIYRARPVVIVDGNVRQKIVTPYQTAEQVAKGAGIVLYPEDKVSLELSRELNDGAGLTLLIERATPFTFTLYGKTSIARTQGKTVAEMLKEKGIVMGLADRISLDSNASIADGMVVRLWREGKQTITVEEPIAFDSDKIENADQSVGYSVIQIAGVNGAKDVTYEITIQDGKEVNRISIASIVTKQPKKQVEIVGVKGQYTTPSENENIAWDFFMANGFSRVQTAGIMGNLMQEHRFSTTGDGLAQWTGSRRANLYSRPYPNNIYTQLQFLMDELNGGYVGVRNAIIASGSLSEAVQIFQNRYERCGICLEGLRIKYASDILASH